MIVVSDTSVISALLSIDKLELLSQLYGKVIIPQVVWDELERLRSFGYDLSPLENTQWLEIIDPKDKELETRLNEVLDKGESAAIALSKEVNPDFLAIDEKKGREIAQSMGIPIIGVVGILIVAKKQAIIQEVKPLLDSLILEAGFRISRKLYEYILKEISED
ncbi:MAG: DUF3368 domain-containing protein [Bacteroidota bacterium]